MSASSFGNYSLYYFEFVFNTEALIKLFFSLFALSSRKWVSKLHNGLVAYFSVGKFLLEYTTPIILYIVFGCFCIVMAVLRSCDRGHKTNPQA